MARHGDSFTKLNKEQIEGILNPLREKIGEFEQRVQATHQESIKERATLAEQIRQIAETGTTMGRETKELREALRGRSQTQGAWGEMVLNTILERSGLRPDLEYGPRKGHWRRRPAPEARCRHQSTGWPAHGARFKGVAHRVRRPSRASGRCSCSLSRGRSGSSMPLL